MDQKSTQKKILIAGPCSIESEYQAMTLAHDIGLLADEYNFDYVFKGSFDKGENVLIVDHNENQLARGLASFNSLEIDKIKGKQSKEIEKILGYFSKSEIIHKDNMVKL